MRYVLVPLAVWLVFASNGICSAATVNITSGSTGTFVLEGRELENVAALDLTVNYDPLTLSGVTVMEGSFIDGSLVAANPDRLGQVRLAAIRTGALNGSGIIATLKGVPLSGSPGRILSLVAKLTDPQGRSLPVQTHVSNPPGPIPPVLVEESGNPPDDPEPPVSVPDGGEGEDPQNAGALVLEGSDGDQDAQPPSGEGLSEANGGVEREGESTTSSTSVVRRGVSGIGSITFPPREPFPRREEERPSEELLPIYPEPDPPPRRRQPDAVKGRYKDEGQVPVSSRPVIDRFVELESVLDRFASYKGERTPKELLGLFVQSQESGFSQSPSVAISDGASVVRVSSAESGQSKELNFAIRNARLVNVWNREEGHTILDVIPEVGVFEASILMVYGDSLVEVPLAVVPPIAIDVDGNSVVSEEDFMLYLDKDVKPNSPYFDLSGDGVRDYIDDYIFAASYLNEVPSDSAPPR